MPCGPPYVPSSSPMSALPVERPRAVPDGLHGLFPAPMLSNCRTAGIRGDSYPGGQNDELHGRWVGSLTVAIADRVEKLPRADRVPGRDGADRSGAGAASRGG